MKLYYFYQAFNIFCFMPTESFLREEDSLIYLIVLSYASFTGNMVKLSHFDRIPFTFRSIPIP